jgi:hypothetical protein
LLIAIVVGQSMGNRVLRQIASQPASFSATPIPTPSASPIDASGPLGAALWKRREVISVATDPGFPDPRVTPEPSPSPTRRPTPRPTPSPSPSPSPQQSDDGGQVPDYTSPPLPIPLVSPGTVSPDPAGAAAPVPSPAAPGRNAAVVAPRPSSASRSKPTLPPYSAVTP